MFKKFCGVLSDRSSLICVYDASRYFYILQIWSNMHFGASDIVSNTHTDFHLEIVQPLAHTTQIPEFLCVFSAEFGVGGLGRCPENKGMILFWEAQGTF